MAEKAKFDRSKPHVNIGTIGHVEHGKTTPVSYTHLDVYKRQPQHRSNLLSGILRQDQRVRFRGSSVPQGQEDL